MKFYLVEISEGDSKVSGKSIYEYETLNDAVATFHSKLGMAMNSELYTSELIMVINSEGGVHKQEKFIREVDPVEEQVEESVE